MPKNTIKKSIFTRLRNNFIAGVVVLIPIGITLYLTLFIIKLSTNLIPKDKNQDENKSYISSLSPREIVSELDRFVIGQSDAKKAVAIALRNRWRRQALQDDMKDEVLPKNILMIGPTGVGKTEISRRLSKLAEAPFVKVEATRFT